MKFIVATVLNGYATLHTSEMLDEVETLIAFDELKEITNNPEAKENFEFWKKYIKRKKYCGLWIILDYDQNSIEYTPIPTVKDYDRLIKQLSSELKNEGQKNSGYII